jgi:hypothetical protein
MVNATHNPGFAQSNLKLGFKIVIINIFILILI